MMDSRSYLSELYDGLVERKAAVELAEAALREAEKAMMATLEGQAYLEAKREVKVAEEEFDIIDASVRQAALEVFQESGEKRPHEHVTVRVSMRASYDESAAVVWAKEHKPEWIRPARIDKRKFEKAARAFFEADMPLDFVAFEESPTVAVSLNGAT